MEYVNINTNDPEDFVLAKAELNKVLIDNEVIENKLSLQEFVMHLNLHNTILATQNGKVVPFSIQRYPDYEKIFYCGEADDAKFLDSELQQINYSFSGLKQLDRMDIINGEMGNKNFFIIDNEYFINPN